VPRTSLKIWSMPPLITCGRNAATRSKCLISKPSNVLARDSYEVTAQNEGIVRRITRGFFSLAAALFNFQQVNQERRPALCSYPFRGGVSIPTPHAEGMALLGARR